jgi:uncharacterized NAD(P)/FAD-binding protein YdhS
MPKTKTIAVVGAGPRGLATLERLVENALAFAADDRITIHVFDDVLPGAGRVWRPDQEPNLLMNTVTSQITMFTDASVRCEGPIRPGPSMYQWIQQGFADNAVAYGPLSVEVSQLGPDDYPSRALYGHYLLWCFDQILIRASDRVAVTVHHARVTALDPGPGLGPEWQLTDSTGERTLADSVVLTLGHLPTPPKNSSPARFAATHELT